MGRNFTLWLFIFSILNSPAAFGEDPSDSTDKKKSRNVSLRITSRAHTAGFFYFGGKVAEYNPAFDINVNLESRNFGYTFFKAVDLADVHSSFNFALAAIYKHIPVGKKLRFTPQLIVLIEQPNKLVDEGSDAGVTLMTTWKINDHFSLEETAILFNLVFEQQHMDMINRLRLQYTNRHFDVMMMAWHNNKLMDHGQHATGGLSVGYNRVRIADRVLLGATLMGSATVMSSDTTDVPERKGVIFTLSATII
jgi:hypothetical protein